MWKTDCLGETLIEFDFNPVVWIGDVEKKTASKNSRNFAIRGKPLSHEDFEKNYELSTI